MNGKILYYNHKQTPLALSNMTCNPLATVEDITDIIEDAKTAHDLIFGLHLLYTQKRIYEWFNLDRETDSYIRLISKDKLGNTHYLKVFKRKNSLHLTGANKASCRDKQANHERGMT